MSDSTFEMSETRQSVRADASIADVITRVSLPQQNWMFALLLSRFWDFYYQIWTFEGLRNFGALVIRSRWSILGALVTSLGTVVAMLALKPAFASEKSSEMALDLAEWTATKDFFEYCLSLKIQGEVPQTCVHILNETLPPPPHLEHSKDNMARLNATLPAIVKREIELRTSLILRHDELMSRFGFAIMGLAVLLIYTTRPYYRRCESPEDPQPQSTLYEANHPQAIWTPNPRRRKEKGSQPSTSNNTEIRYRGSKTVTRPVRTLFGAEQKETLDLRSTRNQPRDYSLPVRDREAEERSEAEFFASREPVRKGRGSIQWTRLAFTVFDDRITLWREDEEVPIYA